MTFKAQFAAGFRARAHDLTHAPVGLWQLNGSLLDSSGNGFTLTANGADSPRFADLLTGIKGGLCNATDSLFFDRGVNDAALDITGDITIEMLLSMENLPVSSQNELISMGSLSTNDTAYRILVVDFRLTFTQKNGGVQNAADFVDFQLPRTPAHVVVQRSGSNILLYVNGALVDTQPIAGSAAANATNRFRIGRSDLGANDLNALLASVKVIAGALTAAQVKDEYNRTLGPVYGVLA